jgi:hypothetical protein
LLCGNRTDYETLDFSTRARLTLSTLEALIAQGDLSLEAIYPHLFQSLPLWETYSEEEYAELLWEPEKNR